MERETGFEPATLALSSEQRDKLAEIANKCPVHKTLIAGLDVIDDIT